MGKRNCSQLVNFFETRGASHIELGDNPASWILRELDAMETPAEQYKMSQEYAALQSELNQIERLRGKKVEFSHKFPTAPWKRRLEINRRLRIIYWRSPAYNYARLLVSLVIAVVLGSAFPTKRDATTFSESEMRARVSVIFLSFIVTGLMAIVSVIPVMKKIRDMFHRHRDALMYDSASMGLALGVAEQAFLLFSTMIFSTVFLAVTGVGQPDEPLADRVERAIGFWVRVIAGFRVRLVIMLLTSPCLMHRAFSHSTFPFTRIQVSCLSASSSLRQQPSSCPVFSSV